jgi:hypothetical protein
LKEEMMIDRYTKLVLTVIALALIGLVARPAFAPRTVEAQQGYGPACGTAAAPCHVYVVGGPASLAAWRGGPIVFIDSQRIVFPRY